MAKTTTIRRARKTATRHARKEVKLSRASLRPLVVLAVVFSLLTPSFPFISFAASHGDLLFEDTFDQNDSGLKNFWGTFSGASSPERKVTDSPNSFAVGVSSTKGMLFEGGSSSNPDDGAERDVATKGYATLHVEYSRAIEEFV